MNLFQLIPLDVVKFHILPYCDHPEIQLEYNTVNYVRKNPISPFRRANYYLDRYNTCDGDGRYHYDLTVEGRIQEWSRYLDECYYECYEKNVISLSCVFCIWCGNYEESNTNSVTNHSKIYCNCI
jgi:hypothetical protein